MKTILKFTVTLSLITWIIYGISAEELGSALSSLSVVHLMIAAILILLQLPVLAHRWFLILLGLGEKPAWLVICRATYLGIFFNQALPGAAGGDIVRIAQLHASGNSLRVSANSVILERLTGLYALVLLMAALSPMVGEVLPGKPPFLLTISLCVVVTLGFITLAYVDQLIPGWRPLAFLKDALSAVKSDYLKLLKDRGTTFYTLLLGAVSWLLNLWAIYVLAIGMGIDIPVTTCFFFSGLSVLVSILPISLAGWGVREGAMVSLFGLVDIPAAQTVTVSITFGVLMVLTSLPAGLLLLHSPQRGQRHR